MRNTLRVGITRDFLTPDGKIGFGDIGLSMLDEADGVRWEFLAQNTPELTAAQIHDFDAMMVLTPSVTAATLQETERLALVARFGVGLDSVDVDACTRHGVLLTITPDGVRRPVAASVITLMLALSHKLLIKDRLTREGRWAEKLNHMGMGLTGRTLGVIGLGNIGRDVFRLTAPFQMRHLAADPFVQPDQLDDRRIELVDLDSLLRESDFVAICCALTPGTHHLVNATRLALMKPSAYLINVARGPIVDQQALTVALRDGQIQGAGLDVFDPEPPDPNDPILRLDNVIVAPHAICWTDECFLGNGRSACRGILDLAQGKVPQNIVNRDAIESPRFQEKLERIKAARLT